MPNSNSVRVHNFCPQKISSILEIMTYVICFITLVVALVDNSLSIKLYTAAAILSVFALILRGKPKLPRMRQWIFPLAILLLGLADLLWYSIFKTSDSPFRATYSSYLNAGKVFSFGAIISFLVLSSNLQFKRETHLYVLYSLSFFVAAYAFYIKQKTGLDRLDFGIGTATGAAYSIMLLGVVSAVSILYTQRSHPALFILNAAVVFFTLALTQTRSTLLLFPVICALALITCYMKSPKKLFFAVVSFLLLFAIMAAIFSKPIYKRYHEGIADINNYSQNDSNNSLGARLAMYEIGFDIFMADPYGIRSVESRDRQMRDLVKKHEYLAGALPFSNVHLHNEVIEAGSLKGVLGIIFTLFFYAALLFTVYQYRSLGLFTVTLAIIGIGLSDVVLWARSIPIIIVMAIVLIIFIKNNNNLSSTKKFA